MQFVKMSSCLLNNVLVMILNSPIFQTFTICTEAPLEIEDTSTAWKYKFPY